MYLLVQKRNQYEYAFRLLVADFLRVCEFVEPTDEHLGVHSHRLYELLLRSCTEFESICREALTAEGYHQKTGNVNVTHYVRVEPKLKLRGQTAILAFWRPDPIDLAPFADWTPQTPSLGWYQGYNAVKHNRNTEFPQANLRNVRDAIAALFIVLARLNIIESDGGHLTAPGGMWQGTFTFEDLPFGLRYEVRPGE
jgi:hypothetical protein